MLKKYSRNKKSSVPAKLRFGIIGCGRRFHKYASAIKNAKIGVLAAVFDIDPAKASEAARTYGCSRKKGMDSLLNDASIDVIIVCSPNYTHTGMALRVIGSGKYCISEKPLGLTSSECRKILQSRYYKGNVFTSFQTRFSKPVKFLIEDIRSGKLGKIRFCGVTIRKRRDREYFVNSWHGKMRLAGGMLFTQGIHGIDLMLELCGTKYEIIDSVRKKTQGFKEQEDIFLSHLRFKGGVLGALEVTTLGQNSEPENSILVVGDKGGAKISGRAFNRLEYFDFGERLGSFKKKVEPEQKSDERFLLAVRDYILLHKKDSSLPLAEDGARATKLIEELYYKARTI